MKTIKDSQSKRMLLLTGMLFFSFLLFAEGSGVIKGRVMDNNNQPVEFATAVLRNLETNKFVTGVVCNYNGEFVIEDVAQGEYTLSTNMIGYKEKEPLKVAIDSLQNRLVEKEVVMNEIPEKSIVVVAKRLSSERSFQTAER